MAVKSRKERKLEELKSLLLSRGSLTRAEAVEAADLDIRTATSYLDELCQLGICRQAVESPNGKGRPGIVYLRDTDNLLFLGIVINRDMHIISSFTDINDNITEHKILPMENQSKLAVFNQVLELVQDARQKISDKKLGAIGVAISRWLQPPLAAYDLYSGLCKYLEEQTGLPVYRSVIINAMAYKAAADCEAKNLIILHPGKVVELGLLRNGIAVQNHHEHEHALGHLEVEPDGSKCYCGKTGCLEHFVTEGALVERLKKIPAVESLAEKPAEALELDIPAVNELIEFTAEYLAEACEYLRTTYAPEKIIIMTISPRLTEAVVRAVEKHKCLENIVKKYQNRFSIDKGAATMAAVISVKQFC